MTITIVTAVDNNGGIGLNGKLPWHVPAELAHFHRTVADMVTVCGVNTYPTLPKTLRERTLVWSGRGWGDNPTVSTDDIRLWSQQKDIAIIGGAATYAAFMPYADKLLISHIHGSFGYDAKFPTISPTVWDWSKRLTPRMVCEQSGLTWDVWEVVRKVQP